MAATLGQAAVDRRAREIETEYMSSLADLNVNSKPLINMLTILAEENLDYAPIIVNAVEKHLAKVQSDVKLPIMYLVDSIVKNVGKQYQMLFSQVIVNMFCGVFETVNERVREKMFNLRQTWNEVFAQSKLYALDIKINSIDPGWPITAQLKPPAKSPAIHVNPIFLKNQQLPDPTLDMQQQLRDKQRELLQLQNKKLELELMATKKRIEEQEKQLVLQTASVSKEPAMDLKRPASGVGSAVVPLPRGRIAPPNAAMINLVKSRDPRLARQQAQLAAQMTAARTNSTPTMVAGVQVPPQHPIALDPSSGKPLSIRERLGRIPKRTDPRLMAAGLQGPDADRKKATSTTAPTAISNSSSPSRRSRSEYDPTKKREKKDETTSKSGRSPSSKSSNSDKKKSSTEMSSPKSSSPLKKKPSSLSEKSPSRSEKTSPKLREGKASKGSKSATRRPGDSSKGSDESSVSPSSSSENLMPVANESKDVDLRLLIPEKKLKLDQQQQQPPQQQQQAKLVSKPLPDQKKALGEAVATDNVPSPPMAISRDVDLRIPPPGLLKDVSDSIVPIVAPVAAATTTSSNSEVAPITDTIPTTVAAGTGSPPDGIKKRPSNHKLEEPAIKKSKSEKLDILFGNEDVDLRKLAVPMNPIDPITPLPPPPPIISEPIGDPRSLQNESPDKHNAAAPSSSKERLEAVRAKIAEATKNKDRDKLGRPLLYNKLSDDPVERRRSLSQPKPMDVDLRQQQQQFQHQDAIGDDNSQDGMNANIKTIVAQAQEQMEKGEITPEQYNILMKQVIQLNETQKIRQAQRMEMMKRNQQPPMVTMPPQASDDNANNAHGGEEMANFGPNLSDDNDIKPSGPPAVPAQVMNDFRGKIAPIDAKPKMEPQFPNAAPAVGQRDPRRQHETRFNPQWGIRGPMPGPNAMPPVMGPVMNQRPPGPMMNPWDQTAFSAMNPNLVPPPIGPRFPPVPIGNGPPGNMLVPGVPKMNDTVRTINIDGIQREIRFYDDIAVIFMSWDEPKEIGFQKGSRMVVVDDRDSFELSFNECHKAITIEGKVYQMKLGAPTRELYIDDSWYECYFGDPPTNIVLDGINRVFKISGPAPQVKIGNSRNDLVAGKINMIVNAEVIVPVFLDSQVQMFEIYGQVHKLQFADFLLTVIIDDQPFLVEYGGLPKVFKLRGKDFYIRFTAVPKLVVPGRVYIRDMIRTPLHRDLKTPPRDQSLLPPFGQPMNNNMMAPMGVQHHQVPSLFPAAAAMQPKSAPVHGMDYLTNLMPHSTSHVNVSNNSAGYQIQPDDRPVVPSVPAPTPPTKPTAGGGLNLPILQNLNIDELYAKIVAAGILGKTSQSVPAKTNTPNNATSATSSTSTTVSSAAASSKLDKALEEEIEEIEPVYLNKLDTVKRRQSAIVSQLFIGMQCSSCGVRFPPEQTMKYSQHLDWHFRQNRRDRDSARKAHSRKWYYDVSDWIQYEEIEDLEEREKNWFESQQSEQIEFNGDGGESGGGGRPGAETPPPSCPAGSDEASRRCHMCHDEFQQFYSEETEEWHLRNAIRVEDCTYHPLCYEDYKASLTLDESAMNATNNNGEGDQSKTEDGVKVKREAIGSDADDSVKEITLDDDDDVIVLPPTEDVVTEIPDDDDIETLDSHSTADDARTTSAAGTATAMDDENSKPDPAGSAAEDESSSAAAAPQEPRIIETRIDDDITIQEPTIEKIDVNDLDESDSNVKSTSTTANSARTSVKVKEEPKDDDEVDEEDELFEDVGTIESSMVESSKEADTVDVDSVSSPTPPLESTSQGQLKPSIDGNVELQDTLTTGIITNRIKINITKAKTTQATTTSSSTTASSIPSGAGGSSIAVLISGGGGGGGGGMMYDNMNDDLLYGNLDDIHGGGHNENSQSNSSSLMMIMHEEEQEQEANNKGPVVAPAEETTEIDYDLKPSLRGIVLTRQPRVENGFETSGLCSIM